MEQTIRDAPRYGKTASYFSIQTRSHRYDFSPRAKVIRTNAAIIVFAFHNLYAWPLANARLLMNGVAVSADQIPQSTVPFADAAVSKMLNASTFARSAAGPSCAECLVIFKLTSHHRKTPAPWAHAEDFWQEKPGYAAWIDPAVPRAIASDPPTGVRPAYCNCGGGGGGGYYGGDYYYYGPGGYYYYGPPGGGGGGGGTPPAATVQTPKGIARLSNCGDKASATKQASASALAASESHGDNEYGSATYVDASGNQYILDSFTTNQLDQVDFSGLAQSYGGLTLESITHVHDGSEDTENPPVFIFFDASNWQTIGTDQDTGLYFSPADEAVSENYGVPIDVVLGQVNQSFEWTPQAKNADGTWDEKAGQTGEGSIPSGYQC